MLMLSNANAKLIHSKTNAKQYKYPTMLSNAKHMLNKYTEHAEHILCTYLQYADHIQFTGRATLPIGVNDGGKEKKRKERRFLELPRPRAGS